MIRADWAVVGSLFLGICPQIFWLLILCSFSGLWGIDENSFRTTSEEKRHLERLDNEVLYQGMLLPRQLKSINNGD